MWSQWSASGLASSKPTATSWRRLNSGVRCVEEDLRWLVEKCVAAGLRNGLTAELVDNFCTQHGQQRAGFYYAFAKFVALQFADGELSYTDGDSAMNDLVGFAEFEVDGFAWEIFSAFDSGEFYREEDPEGTIPWQKYTLPTVMEVLCSEGLLPRR